MPWLKLCAAARKRRQHVALKEHAVFISENVLTRASAIHPLLADLQAVRLNRFNCLRGIQGQTRRSYF
jgi:hypothetical protein